MKITDSLRTWWTDIKSQEDSIQVSDDLNSSLLSYESSVSEIDGIANHETVNVTTVIEVNETAGLISAYLYVENALSEELAAQVGVQTLNVNPRLSLGHFELYTPKQSNEHFLRFRSAMQVQSVESDLVAVLDDLVQTSNAQFVRGLGIFLLRDELAELRENIVSS